MSKDCFFIVDMTENEEKSSIKTLCTDCYMQHYQTGGWFWEGSARGYSPYIFKCNHCEAIIHEPEET